MAAHHGSGFDLSSAQESRDHPHRLECAQPREINDAAQAEATVDQATQALCAIHERGILASAPEQRGGEFADASKDGLVGRNEVFETPPLVDHAKPLHQDLLRSHHVLVGAIVFDLPRLEIEGAAVPAQDVEESVLGEETLELLEFLFGDQPELDGEAAYLLGGCFALALQGIDAPSRCIASTREHFGDGRTGMISYGCCE